MHIFNILHKVKWFFHSKKWIKSRLSGCVQLKFYNNSRIIESHNHSYIGIAILDAATPKNAVTCISLRENSELYLDGATIGKGSSISTGPNGKIHIGHKTFINDGSRISASKEIKIGSHCSVSFNVTIIDDDGHSINSSAPSAPIVIEDNVWVGCNVIILKGVTIGHGSVVAAGSIVTESCPPQSLMAGVPAKVLKTNVNWKD